MRDFRGLKVWRRAHGVALDIYKATGPFPRGELFGLTSQMRRAAVSVAANIAEACGRTGEREFARFLNISLGSASELEYHLLLAHDLRLLPDPDHERLASEVTNIKRMLAGLIRTLRSKAPS